MDGTTGNMIHSTVPPGQINRATIHSTVSEFWYVLEGIGQIWRKDGTEERVTSLVPAFPSIFQWARHFSTGTSAANR